MKNYDLNIWDKLAWETSGEQEGGWHIGVYEQKTPLQALGSGTFREELSFDLTPSEAKQLTLGWDTEVGGVYSSDEDFFLDLESFLDIYKDVMPPRVLSLLKALPE
jgi:hypothetical protein